MKIQEEYKSIDSVKKEGVRSHCISCCRGKIDKLYDGIIEKDNIEIILYQRKSKLILELKWHSDAKLSFLMTFFGAFLGVYVSYIVTYIITGIIVGMDIVFDYLSKTDPMQVMYSKDNMIFFLIHLILVIGMFIVGKTIIKRSNNKKDKIDIQFYEDMSKYELEKIDKLLNNM